MGNNFSIPNTAPTANSFIPSTAPPASQRAKWAQEKKQKQELKIQEERNQICKNGVEQALKFLNDPEWANIEVTINFYSKEDFERCKEFHQLRLTELGYDVKESQSYGLHCVTIK